MQSFLELPISEMAGKSFFCSCGKEHRVEISEILVGSGVFVRLPEVVERLGARTILLVADENTYAVAGKQAEQLLTAAGISVRRFVYPGTDRLVPDEAALGALLAELMPEDDLLLAVGSGTLNDITRLVSARTKIPYVIAATAPSMDGFASTVSPLILGGHKITKDGVYPAAIVADVDILKDAPMEMLTAGYGDVLGKLTSNADWRLARELKGESYCDICAELVNQAVEKCAENAVDFRLRKPEAVYHVTQGLILSGVAMGLFGNSRPASGAEHHFSHYWEVEALKHGEAHSLHGNSVAVGAVLSASLYELAAPHLPKGFMPPDKTQVLSLLRSAGAPVHPKEIGISRSTFHDSILHAMEIRERYTILRFCQERGLLESFADIITGAFFDT